MMEFDELIGKIVKESGRQKQEVEKLIEEKQDELSGLVSKEGAAYIVGRELGVNLITEGKRELKIKNLVPDLKSVEMALKVLRVFEPKAFEKGGKKGVMQSIIVGDETGNSRLVLWGEDVEKAAGIKEGDSIRVAQAYSKKAFGGEGVEIGLGKRGTIEVSGEVVGAVGDSKTADTDEPGRIEIKDVKENSYAELRGCIVQLFKRNPFFFVCPDCGKKVAAGSCSQHGSVKPVYNMILSGIIDDGTGVLRIVFFRELAEKLAGKKAVDSVGLKDDLDGFYNGIACIGKEVVVAGRIKRSDFSGELEMVANRVEDVDPKAECRRLLDGMKS